MFILQYENSVHQDKNQWALEPSRTSAGKEPQVRHPWPSVFSPCVFLCLVSSSSLFLRVSSVPAISTYSDLLVIPTPACLIDSAFASPLLVPLPDLRPSACVPNLDLGSTRIYIKPYRCLPPIGLVCLLLDCLTVYRTRSVKAYATNLCLWVEHT